MPKNAQKSNSTDIFPGGDHAAVRQDKIGGSSDQAATPRPVRTAHEPRSAPGKEPGTPDPSSQPRACVPVTAHVRPEIKTELERLARQGRRKGEWLSLSRTAATLLEKGVQGTIDMQYGALLRPVIEMELRKGLLAYNNRLANIAFNSFNSAEQTRILVIQLLSYLLGDQNDILPGLVAQSQKEALKNLKAHFPDGEEDEAEQQND